MNICHIQLHFSKEFHCENSVQEIANIICKIQLKLNSFIANLACDSIYYRQLATCNDSQRRFTAFSHCAIDKFMCAHCWHYIYIRYIVYIVYISVYLHTYSIVYGAATAPTQICLCFCQSSLPLSLSLSFFLISIYGLAFVS